MIRIGRPPPVVPYMSMIVLSNDGSPQRIELKVTSPATSGSPSMSKVAVAGPRSGVGLGATVDGLGVASGVPTGSMIDGVACVFGVPDGPGVADGAAPLQAATTKAMRSEDRRMWLVDRTCLADGAGGRGLEPRTGELLAPDRRDSRERAGTRDAQRAVDREDDPELRAGDGARGAAGLEVGADPGLHLVAVRILEVDVEVVALVRLVPIHVDRDRDPDHERRRERRKPEHVPGAPENVQLAGDGRGFGPDAIRTLARYLFEVRGHHRLTIDPAASNERAIAVYERVGFRRVGVMRRYERGPDGEFHDGVLLDMLRGELT